MTAGSPGTDLHWLAMPGDFRSGLSQALAETEAEARWEALVALAGLRLDFLQTMKLDRALSRTVAFHDRPGEARIKVALVGSSTLEHLVPAIRIGALRRGLLVEPWLAPFGQWRQDILDPRSGLHRFAPDAVLLCLDSASLVPDIPLEASPDEVAGLVRQTVDDIASLWRSLKERLGATVIQQTILPIEVPAFGHFERQVPAAPGAVADRLDRELVDAATREGVLLLDLRRAASSFGVRALGDPMLWHHARQEIAPPAAPWVGDQVARILAATRGLSKKVLVLDLDNTLWGGVIGDDGIENIVLGQGSAAGEAFVAFQRYVKRLAQRGVILAVSSKNDLAVAASAFDDHPEMVLRRHDIAAFEASWGDKPAALRRIAKDLDVGLDSLVFFDDNPAERALMRQSLPMVAVPEVPDAVDGYVACLSEAGYFETVSFTADDRGRSGHYAANALRKQAASGTTDLEAFLHSLGMRLIVLPFRPVDVPRIAQLINKSNQFNVTTRRYTEVDVAAMMNDRDVLTFSARLDDRFGSNGIVSVVIGRVVTRDGIRVLDLDTWLMSCRVLGRSVENAMLRVVADAAREAGASRLVGHYRQTSKNGMVADLYGRLGFEAAGTGAGQESLWSLDLGRQDVPVPEFFSLLISAEAAQ